MRTFDYTTMYTTRDLTVMALDQMMIDATINGMSDDVIQYYLIVYWHAKTSEKMGPYTQKEANQIYNIYIRKKGVNRVKITKE